jgi:flagellar biosynthesis anti-sigma factor FlgM
MQISNNETLLANQVGAINRTGGVTDYTQTPAQAEDTTGTAPAAQVELSSQAQAIASAKAAVDATPETRDDLVARLKSQVDAGTYQVSGKDIAEQMLRRAQADRLR